MAKKPAPKNAKPATKTKPKAKAPSAGKTIVAAPRREETVTVRSISNGFVTRTSKMVGKGDKARYVEEEVFSKTAPKITVPK